MSGPSRQFDEAEVLRNAMGLFWEQGFEGTSIDELCRSTGLNRSSMYNAFGDKEALYYRALTLFANERVAFLAEAMEGKGTAIRRLMRGLNALKAHSASHGRTGCFCCSAASELGPSDAKASRIINDFFGRITQLIRSMLEQAVAAAELNPNTDTVALAGFILVVVSGVATLERSSFPIMGLESLPALLRADVWHSP